MEEIIYWLLKTCPITAVSTFEKLETPMGVLISPDRRDVLMVMLEEIKEIDPSEQKDQSIPMLIVPSDIDIEEPQKFTTTKSPSLAFIIPEEAHFYELVL